MDVARCRRCSEGFAKSPEAPAKAYPVSNVNFKARAHAHMIISISIMSNILVLKQW